jgi:hypothetical protein
LNEKKCITHGCNQIAWNGKLYCNKCLLENYFKEQNNKNELNQLKSNNKNKTKLTERGKNK